MPPHNTTRFFDSKMALLGGGAFVAGLGFGAHCVYRVINERKISIRGFLFAAFLILLGIGLFASAFPKGCRACRKRFAEGGTTFPAQHYDKVVAAFQQGSTAAIADLAPLPAGSHEGWAGLAVNYCAECRRLGEVTVSEQSATGQYAKYLRGTGAIAVSVPVLTATLDLLQRRTITTSS